MMHPVWLHLAVLVLTAALGVLAVGKAIGGVFGAALANVAALGMIAGVACLALGR